MDEREVLRACRAFRLERRVLRAHGELGQQLGRHAGSSLEFHDYRAYQPGDDLRRIDWAVYGRSEQLTVRVLREEIQPRLDVVLDRSRSMALDDGHKPRLASALASFATHSARLQGSSVRVHAAGEDITSGEHVPEAAEARRCVLFEEPARCARVLRRGGLRLVVSDFMTEHDVKAVIRELSAGAAQLVVVRTLGPWEASPSLEGATTLEDLESGAELPGELAAASLERYRRRLQRLSGELEDACRAVGARLANVVCDVPLLDALRRDLLPVGVVAPS